MVSCLTVWLAFAVLSVTTCVDALPGEYIAFGDNSLRESGIAEVPALERQQPRVSQFFEGIRLAHLDAGASHMVACTEAGILYAWGNGEQFALGQGATTETAITPTPVTTPDSSFRCLRVAASDRASFALGANGVLYAWGMGDDARHGKNSDADLNTPMLMQQQTPNAQGGLAPDTHVLIDIRCNRLRTCIAWDATGRHKVWGNDGDGQGGVGTQDNDRDVPASSVYFQTRGGIADVAIGTRHSLVLTNQGALYGMGRADSSQLGTSGPPDSFSSPISITVGQDLKVSRISAGNDWSAVITETAELFVFGSNANSACGKGTIPTVASPLRLLLTGTEDGGAIAVAAGFQDGAAVDRTFTVHTWGLNDVGQAGDGTTTTKEVPAALPSTADGLPKGELNWQLVKSNKVGLVYLGQPQDPPFDWVFVAIVAMIVLSIGLVIGAVVYCYRASQPVNALGPTTTGDVYYGKHKQVGYGTKKQRSVEQPGTSSSLIQPSTASSKAASLTQPGTRSAGGSVVQPSVGSNERREGDYTSSGKRSGGERSGGHRHRKHSHGSHGKASSGSRKRRHRDRDHDGREPIDDLGRVSIVPGASIVPRSREDKRATANQRKEEKRAVLQKKEDKRATAQQKMKEKVEAKEARVGFNVPESVQQELSSPTHDKLGTLSPVITEDLGLVPSADGVKSLNMPGLDGLSDAGGTQELSADAAGFYATMKTTQSSFK